MCFAFRESTSANDQNLVDMIPVMTKTTPALKERHASPTASASTLSSTCDSDDCIELEPPKKTLSTLSNAVQRSGRKESENGEASDESEVDENDESAAAAAASTSINRKRPGSRMVKRTAKKAKVLAVYERPKPSGKGEDYDDLCYRANIKLQARQRANNQLVADLTDMQDERDDALFELTILKKNSQAALHSMKTKLKSELETKHKSTLQTQTQTHKSALLLLKEKVSLERSKRIEAERAARELQPEHSTLLKETNATIAELTTQLSILSSQTSTLQSQLSQLRTSHSTLTHTHSVQTTSLHNLLEASRTHVLDMSALKKSQAAEKKLWAEKWKIQYDNSQESARRASEAQRALFGITAALNQSVERRGVLEGEVRVLRAQGRREG